MNIHEAALSGKPFTHPDMIGAYMFINENLYHRDNEHDFTDLEWVVENCGYMKYLNWFEPYDLIRTDWKIINI